MSTREIIYAAAGASGLATYIEDVFSTYLYTGNGSSQTITNNIDLSGKGGLVWIKGRNEASDGAIFDTNRGISRYMYPTGTAASTLVSGYGVTAFNNNGFAVTGPSGYYVNTDTTTYASWTFRKQAKFFDVVTYTGNGSTQNISHNLGSVPGMIIVKRLNANGWPWVVYHRSIGSSNYLSLNTTAASAGDGGNYWNNTSPTSSVFSVGGGGAVNADTGTYVAYLFAHNAGGFGLSGTDNVISCGSYTGTGATQSISLGYEPQYVLLKNATSAGWDWYQFDIIRGMSNTSNAYLSPNTSAAETVSSSPQVVPTATGFNIVGSTAFNLSGNTYIYVAIRRGPMKTPTSGTEVLALNTWTGDATDNRYFNTGLTTDFFLYQARNQVYGNVLFDRLRGNLAYSYTTSNTNAEGGPLADFLYFTKTQTGVTAGFAGYGNINQTGYNNVGYSFRRAPGFFDVVCWRTGLTTTTQSHNLGVVPELIIYKCRSTAGDWIVYSANLLATQGLFLNTTDAAANAGAYWDNTRPTSTVFTSKDATLGSNANFVAYLFASVAGVSKVGSYTGTGGTQTINAGLPTGARFVLIKRTDSTGDWWVWDTARGMVSGTDPRLNLNTTAAELNNNWVYTVTNGFQIVTTDATVNASGGSYIYLAIA